jgi:hypothetical protein
MSGESGASTKRKELPAPTGRARADLSGEINPDRTEINNGGPYV